LRLMVDGDFFVSFEGMVIVPVFDPKETGLKVTVMVQEPPLTRGEAQVLTWENSDPPTETVPMMRLPGPVLFTVIVFERLPPFAVEPK